MNGAVPPFFEHLYCLLVNIFIMPCHVFSDGETFVTSRFSVLIVNRETFKPIKTLHSLESS